MKINKGQVQQPPRIMLVGIEGVGKTTFGAQAPNCLFVCAENGLVGSGYADTDNVTPATWSEVLEAVDAAKDYDNLVFDSVDWMEPLLHAFICARDGKKNIEDYGYGKGGVLAGVEWRKLICKMEVMRRQKNLGIIFLAHSNIKTFNNPDGDNYDRYAPKCGKEITALTKEWCDVVLFARFEVFTRKDGAKSKGVMSGKRVVHTTQSAAWDAKNRYGLPEVLPLDYDIIMTAIKSGKPVKEEDIIAEIRELSAGLTAEDKAKVEAAILKHKNNTASLAQILNQVRVKN